ncbi:MAG: transcriptional regulator [Actinobacteria bacterium]|nr:transcriptional regulator [Actinomycetota bacterium]
MAFISHPAFLTLHVLRVRGITETAEIATTTGLSEDAVVAELAKHREQEFVVLREGRLPGWALTHLGRNEDADLSRVELDTASARNAVDAAYLAFLDLNPGLLRVCTDWQLFPPIDNKTAPELNVHEDAAYDAEVLDRLFKIDGAAQPICAALADALARFSNYGPRLQEARRRVEAGEHDWMTKPMIDSYHSVWFELHEDLLATLGIERGSEPNDSNTEDES